ncbi:glycosyltransferase [Novosphingobium sp. CF614]|uniref:glycosyltransferase n=1 Tax=Novosphingobium sp. CF614 TaxID=1884364 RepID=UPI0015A63DEB|nr:glycosyltransferase [Novosphingobium sp. CF614]
MGLAGRGYDIHLLSAEKAGTEAIAADYRARFAAAGVRWTTIRYHKPLVGTVRDLLAMMHAALRIARRERIALVHCRSHPPMPVALAVKRWTGARVLFDFRDFWADSGIAKGRFVPVYRWIKRRERGFILGADHVNCITARGGEHLRRLYPEQRASWSVIPCCADFDLFRLDADAGTAARARLNIPADATVLLYLGSLGPDYLLDDMMRLFKELRGLRSNAVFLLMVNNDSDLVEQAAAAAGIPQDTLRVANAQRKEVPGFIAAADLSVVFRADLSKLGCSPTKLGETLACGVPVIANNGVGDLDALLSPAVNGSLALADLAPATMRAGLEQVLARMKTSAQIRKSALAFSLEAGIGAYASVYEALGAGEC